MKTKDDAKQVIPLITMDVCEVYFNTSEKYVL